MTIGDFSLESSCEGGFSIIAWRLGWVDVCFMHQLRMTCRGLHISEHSHNSVASSQNNHLYGSLKILFWFDFKPLCQQSSYSAASGSGSFDTNSHPQSHEIPPRTPRVQFSPLLSATFSTNRQPLPTVDQTAHIELGYSMMRTIAPKLFGGRLCRNCARTMPELPVVPPISTSIHQSITCSLSL